MEKQMKFSLFSEYKRHVANYNAMEDGKTKSEIKICINALENVINGCGLMEECMHFIENGTLKENTARKYGNWEDRKLLERGDGYAIYMLNGLFFVDFFDNTKPIHGYETLNGAKETVYYTLN